VHVMTPLQPGETIHQLQALVFLNYTLNSHAKLNMDALAAVSHTSHLPALSFSADGDLRLVMRSPARVVREYVSALCTPRRAQPTHNLTMLFATAVAPRRRS
jgi:hypothetical protein